MAEYPWFVWLALAALICPLGFIVWWGFFREMPRARMRREIRETIRDTDIKAVTMSGLIRRRNDWIRRVLQQACNKNKNTFGNKPLHEILRVGWIYLQFGNGPTVTVNNITIASLVFNDVCEEIIVSIGIPPKTRKCKFSEWQRVLNEVCEYVTSFGEK